MAIAPDRGQTVAPDRFQFVEGRLLLSELRRGVYAARLIAFARAPGAGAVASQRLVVVDARVTVRPVYQQAPTILIQRVGEGQRVVR